MVAAVAGVAVVGLAGYGLFSQRKAKKQLIQIIEFLNQKILANENVEDYLLKLELNQLHSMMDHINNKRHREKYELLLSRFVVNEILRRA